MKCMLTRIQKLNFNSLLKSELSPYYINDDMDDFSMNQFNGTKYFILIILINVNGTIYANTN